MNDRRMGGACSMQRHTSSHRRNSSSHDRRAQSDGTASSSSASSRGRRFSRHSVVSAIPDDAISNFYPLSDNYVLEENGLRSPKTLAELCTDTLCRSLPYLDGALPPGLPQDVVDDVVASLVAHSALNVTTLTVLRNCELGSLTLAGCRGVSDEWLSPLSGALMEDDGNAGMVAMDLDGYASPGQPSHLPPDVFYNAPLEESNNSVVEESSCSTSSFVSANSTNHRGAVASEVVASSPCKEEDHPMLGEIQSSGSNATYNDDSCMSFTDHDASSSSSYFYSSRRRSSSVTSNMTLLDLRGSQRLSDKGLKQLSDLSSLEVAQLDGCYSIQGKGLVAFSLSHRLRSLSLANCRRLTDEAIINISHLTCLETLSLDGCRCLTDRSMEAIGCLTQIKKLDLSQCDLITDAGLEQIARLHKIEELSLGWCRSISDHGIRVLCSQPGRSKNLRVLSLARIGITDDGVGDLGKLQALEELDLNGCSSLGSSCLGDVLAKLIKLKILDVSYCPGILRSSWQGKVNSLKTLECCYSAVRDSHLSRFTDLPALEEINLDSCPLTDWSMSHLADGVMPNLTSLDLADTDISDHGMVHIAKFKKLKRLSLFYCNLSNSSLRHLSTLTNLEVLNLDSREISDGGLFHLLALQNLKSLDIFSGRITDSGCSFIAKIKTLENLELCGGGISDVGCTILAGLEKLTSLNLSQNERITNRGAAALATLSNLKTLNLSNTRVNAEALVYFSDMKSLKSLALYGCRGMDDATNNLLLDKLQSGLPNLKCIRLNNGADDDGVISTSEEDSDEENFDESETEQVIFSTRFSHNRTAAASPFEDTDSDSEMEDAPDTVDNEYREESESSYSDHDY
mmetsp:Transcript_20650/g.36294  ORF Transcript_20650/g.36294 Transcript_20650/m.36294 type:complete len:854 (-) Transcript_20650:1632-4193(-)